MKPTTFFRHDTNWIRRHGMAANSGSKICNQCHAETFCADCHDQKQTFRVDLRNPEKIDREFVHRGDYLTRHMIDGKTDPASCYRCHGRSNNEQCVTCHR